MNQRKYDRLVREQNGPATKVLEATPLQEPWTAQQIQQELKRTGHRMVTHIVFGCLNTLKQAGLVKEPRKGEFTKIRRPRGVASTPARPALKVAPQPHIKQHIKQEEEPMTDTMDAFEALKKRVNQLGLKVQTLATHIEEEVAEINEQIDNVTLQCMEGQEANNEELKKLRTLATALKALS